MQMPSETFDLLWNSLLNAELTDSGTSSSFGEGDKLVDKPESTRWRKQDDGYYNNKSSNSNYSKGITSKRRNSAVYATYAVLQYISFQSNLQSTGEEEVPVFLL